MISNKYIKLCIATLLLLSVIFNSDNKWFKILCVVVYLLGLIYIFYIRKVKTKPDQI